MLHLLKDRLDHLKYLFGGIKDIPPLILIAHMIFYATSGYLLMRGMVFVRANPTPFFAKLSGYSVYVVPYIWMVIYAIYARLVGGLYERFATKTDTVAGE